ncbi:MAG: AAA family ATPase [Clostridiales bacterium]|nr:AAA family ATPase [Clostridiales bacterium]MCF8021316.1 AAA family ATPase [Clostridiales bacterium]
MFITKIIIENFQSHEFTEFELSPGLTVLVGESDQGKSAVIRALRWLFENEPRGTGFIRAGSAGARVTVIMSDGSSITRERTSGKNRYILRGPGGEKEIYEGFGTGVPAEIKAVHGVSPVKLDEDLHVSLNISPQLAGPFLLSSPGSLKAKAIGRLHSVHIIDAAARDADQEILSLQKEDNRLEEQVEKIDVSLEKYEDLPSMQNDMDKCKREMRRLAKYKQKLTELVSLKKELSRVKTNKENAERIFNNLHGMEKCNQNFIYMENSVDKLKSIQKLQQQLNLIQKDLKQVDHAFKKTYNIRQKFESIRRLENYLHTHQNLYNTYLQLNYIYNASAVLKEKQENLNKAILAKQLYQKNKDYCEELYSLKKIAESLHDRKQSLNYYRNMLDSASRVQDGNNKYNILKKKAPLLNELIFLKGHLDSTKQKINNIKDLLCKVMPSSGRSQEINDLIKKAGKITHLQEYSNRISDTRLRLIKGQNYLEERKAELKHSALQYSMVLKELGRCPTCFNEVDQDTLERIIQQLTEGSEQKIE